MGEKELEFINLDVLTTLSNTVKKIENVVGKLDNTKLKPVIEELHSILINSYTGSCNDFNMYTYHEGMKRLAESAFIIQFYARYNDNVELLRYLIKEGITFDIEKEGSLFILNSNLSSHFTKEVYVNMIRTNRDIFKYVHGYENSNDIIEVLKINPQFKLYRRVDSNTDDNLYPEIINADSCNVFGHEFIANADKNKQKILYTLYEFKTYNETKEILKLNPNFILYESNILNYKIINTLGINTVAFSDKKAQEKYANYYYYAEKYFKELVEMNSDFKIYDQYIFYKEVIKELTLDIVVQLTMEEQIEISRAVQNYKSSFYSEEEKYKKTLNRILDRIKNDISSRMKQKALVKVVYR